MKTYGLTNETLAMVSVVQREWAAKNPRATFKTPITVEDVLNSRMIAYPFRLLQCCLVTDGGGALILVAAEHAKDFPRKPVYLIGTGESVETPMVSQMQDFTSSRAFRVAGAKAFAEAGITHNDVDHLMIYDAFAHLPIYGLEDLGFVGRGEAGAFITERNTAPGGKLPLNTNGGGLSYMHSGMYGMYALQESVRQMRQDLGLPRRRRHVRRLRHDHHVERAAFTPAVRRLADVVRILCTRNYHPGHYRSRFRISFDCCSTIGENHQRTYIASLIVFAPSEPLRRLTTDPRRAIHRGGAAIRADRQ